MDETPSAARWQARTSLTRIKDGVLGRAMRIKPGCDVRGKSIGMRLVRTLLAFVIALSLAMLPIGASATGVAMSSIAMASDDMQQGMPMTAGAGMTMDDMTMAGISTAGVSMDDCCPDDMKGNTSHAAGEKCGMGLCCAGGIALDAVQALAFDHLAAVARTLALPADQVVSVRGASPPFRPPRV